MKIKAACGLDCATCPVYAATVSGDEQKLDAVIREWGAVYNREFTREDIKCLGCRSDTLFGLCVKCPMRDCADSKNHASCHDCADFECARLKQMYRFNENSTNVERWRE